MLNLIHFNYFDTFNSKKLSINADNTKYTIGITDKIYDILKNESVDISYYSLVFIKDVSKIWTHGKIYNCGSLDLNDFSTNLKYFKGIKVENDIYDALEGGDYLSFTSKDPTTVQLNVLNNSVEIGLTEEFVSRNTTPYIYTIEPSVTGIHLNNRGKLNTYFLDVWVNVDGKEHVTITDQSYLDNLNLSVWFSIDDDSTRHKLIIGGSYVIETEEGEAIIVAEEDDDENNLIITLESESIDISKINDKINLYLIKDANSEGYGEELNKIYIPVTKDGGPLKALTEINKDNLEKYIVYGKNIDIDKCHSYILLKGSLPFSLDLVLPSLPLNTGDTDYFNARMHIGTTICLYNNSDKDCGVVGRCRENESSQNTSVNIPTGNFAWFTCKCTITDDKEDIYWEFRKGVMYY